jgi:acetoacetyl-CoA synthetase
VLGAEDRSSHARVVASRHAGPADPGAVGAVGLLDLGTLGTRSMAPARLARHTRASPFVSPREAAVDRADGAPVIRCARPFDLEIVLLPEVEPIWTPPAALADGSEMAVWLRELGLPDYNSLWEWSVADVGRFWRRVWDRFGVQADGDPAPAIASAAMPGAEWFPGVALSYPEHVFLGKRDDDPAVWFLSEGRAVGSWEWGRLRRETARIRAGLVEMGVGRGDRVAGVLPNIPQTIAAFLATSSLGAIWSCCSPDFGSRTIVDRFAQIEPKVLMAVDGYRYGGREFDRRELLDQLRDALPTLERTVVFEHLAAPDGDWGGAFPDTGEPLAFDRVPFDHPLWIVYSSGTTGLPKAIVHGHGGIVLEHLKNFRLHHDVRPGDRLMWFTTTGWIMWNYLVSGLLSDVSIVIYDGNPGHPDLGTLWQLAADTGATLFGCGAAFIHGCMKAGIDPADGRDLSALRSIGSTGSPLAPEGFDWIYDRLGADIWLASVSGGTDIAGAFIGGAPIVPVYRGELPARYLGVDVQAWDEDGQPVLDEVGELVVTQPMPSMPVRFWNDPGNERYLDSYFSTYPGVWRHGDWLRITPRGSAVIYGRSDSTINRGGIRIGTAEVYSAVLALDAIGDALAVDVPSADGTGDGYLYLFVVLAGGAVLDDALQGALRAAIRRDCSPRHVPDEVIVVPEVPKTLTGKLLEVPVKRLLMGRAVQEAANRDALANPEALDWFVEFAAARRGAASAAG